jgi:hypothetical protein
MRYLRDPFGTLLRAADRFGDPYSWPTFLGKMVITGDPEGIRTVLSADPDIYEALGATETPAGRSYPFKVRLRRSVRPTRGATGAPISIQSPNNFGPSVFWSASTAPSSTSRSGAAHAVASVPRSRSTK